MAMMPRPRSKATKIAQAITGVPQNLKNFHPDKHAECTPGYGFTYGHKFTSTILKGGGS
jgi:hypothetical protein